MYACATISAKPELDLSPDGASIISEKSAEAGLDVGPSSILSLPSLSGTANADLLTRGGVPLVPIPRRGCWWRIQACLCERSEPTRVHCGLEVTLSHQSALTERV